MGGSATNLRKRKGPSEDGSVRGAASGFIKMLHRCATEQDFSEAVAQLRKMGPSAVDVEVRMLQPEKDLEPLMQLFLAELRKGTNFELVEAQLGLVLRVH